MKSKFLFLFVFLKMTFCGWSQSPTVGVISHSVGSKDDGFVLFAPMQCDTTYLIDKCGNLIHRWMSGYKPGLATYILNDGALLRAGNVLNPAFTTGGRGGIIERIDWNNNVVWSYKISDSLKCQHHDMEMMPNGNILTIVWVKKNHASLIAAGANTSLIGADVLSEQIVELQPLGIDSAKVVWTWNLWDHLVQDYDAGKPNYGVVSQNPQLFNLNYGMSTNPDWIHLNSIDYNPTLDQIIINSRNINEFYVLDHSTTTAQAASHTGGIYGKGGDFLYRWGSPMVYNHGTVSDQKLFGQHNVQWITNTQHHQNQLLLFNDGNGRTSSPATDYSTVEFLTPPVTNGVYNQTLPYLPAVQDWIYSDTPPTKFYASYTSGAQLLDNGNILICNGPAGYFFEIDTLKNKVWEYVNPVATTITTQGNSSNQNNTFRCNFYESSYAGFVGKDVTPGLPIEANPINNGCTLNTGILQFEKDNAFKIYPNPTSGVINVQSNITNYRFTIYDAYGKKIYTAQNTTRYNLEPLVAGVYNIQILTSDGKLFNNKIIVAK
ncbi:MAG: aryl-sulfate sulfotransferase [Bacteroidia bacterium]